MILFKRVLRRKIFMKRNDEMEQKKILEILNLSPESEKAVVLALSKKKISEISKTAYLGEISDFPILRLKPVTRLAVVVHLICGKYDDYLSLGVPPKIIEDTFRDISLRAELYLKEKGKPGISKNDALWFRHIINCQIFKVGVLQFQAFEMIYLDKEFLGETYMEFSKAQKEKLPSGSPVINCHIQTGADLSNDRVSLSFSDAQRLFEKLFPDRKYRAFICYSWLLYPDMTGLLPKGSKIKSFAENFEIIGSISDSEQAFENIFGKAYKRPPKLQAPTALQKLASENPKSFGFACGVKYL